MTADPPIDRIVHPSHLTSPQVGTHCHERGDLLFHVLRRCDEIAHTFAADADTTRVAKSTAETQREFHFFPGPSIVHTSNGETQASSSASSTASVSANSGGSATHSAGASAATAASNGMKHAPFPPEWAQAPVDSLEFKAWLLVQQNEALEHR